MVNEVKRGDIFYVENELRKAACEQEGIRPAVIIQNDVGNIYSPTVIVTFLTTKNKKMMPTHVHTDATPRPSIAVIVAAVMLLVVIFGIVVPRTRDHVKEVMPEDSGEKSIAILAFEEYRKRDLPVITSDSEITITSGELINFSQLIQDGKITAVNADGVNISSNIAVKAGDAASQNYLMGKVFGLDNPAAGTYTVILYVVDHIPASDGAEAVYYGLTAEKEITIIVQ